MVDAAVLASVKTIVTHAGCADGVASALILKDVLPCARVLFVQYSSPEWRSVDFSEGGGSVLYCDMTPSPEQVDEAVESGAIVLDHHRGAREVVAKFGARGVFADEVGDPGVSGAMLAFREVWESLYADGIRRGQKVAGLESWSVDCAIRRSRVLELAELAGIRDTWQRHSPRWGEACAQAEALRFWPWEDLSALNVGGAEFAGKMGIGPVLLRKRAERVERSIGEAYRFTVTGVAEPGSHVDPYRCLVFEGLSDVSDVADRVSSDVDLVLGWHYACEEGRPMMIVSCRSRGSFPALRVAKRYGGGGHEHAAGFTLMEPGILNHASNPYHLLQEMVTMAVTRE